MKPDPKGVAGSSVWNEAPLDWPRSAGQVEGLLAAVEERKKRERRRRRRTLSAAAGIGAVTLLMAGVFFPGLTSSPPADRGVVASAGTRTALITVPERRTLPDGSTVELKPGAEFELAYAPRVRMVRMIRGEALFDVAHDSGRPFVVAAGDFRFRAVGTAFSVEVSAHAVEMLVTEGTVAVERAEPAASEVEPAEMAARETGPTPSAATLVGAGNRIVVELAAQVNEPRVMVTSPLETSEKLAWRVPRLQFNETPLHEIVGLLNRYSGSRISLPQAELGRVEISGSLRADNIEPLLQILDVSYQIQAVRHPDGAIELRRRP